MGSASKGKASARNRQRTSGAFGAPKKWVSVEYTDKTVTPHVQRTAVVDGGRGAVAASLTNWLQGLRRGR